MENVLRRLRENSLKPEAERLPVKDIVFRASSEIRGSVVFATVIVILVLLPLFMLESVEGRLLKPLGFAYVVALTASLIVALTVTPALCSYLLPRAKAVLKGKEPRFVAWLKRMYQPPLGWSMRHPVLVMCGAALLLVAAAAGSHWMGRSFLPEFNEGTLTISAVTLPGTSLAQSDELGRSLEKILLSVPEVTATARRTGRTELDEHVQGVESAELDVNLKMRNRPKHEPLEDIRQRVSILPGMNVTIGQPISHRIDHMLSGTRANIAVKIFGDDLPTLRALAKQVQTVVQQTPGAVDVSTEQQMEIPTVRVRWVRAAAFGPTRSPQDSSRA